jgi:DNA-binding transcriptional ArsR family regulator
MSVALDSVFQALAHPVRRQVVARLAAGPQSVLALHAEQVIALPTFTRHLQVLEEAGLVRSQRQGRTRTLHLAPDGLHRAEGWLDAQLQQWTQRLDRLDAFLTQTQETDP